MWSSSKKYGLIGVVLFVFSGLAHAESNSVFSSPAQESIRADAGDLQTFQERTRQVKS
jgi:hypothetical protein